MDGERNIYERERRFYWSSGRKPSLNCSTNNLDL